MGIEKERILPAYTAQPFYQWFNKRTGSKKLNAPKVVLFADTYLNYHEPNIGIAATELLEAVGYEVLLAAQNLDKYFQQGLKVVVCEPSCASALKDDLPDLIEDAALAKRLRDNVQMIDVFLMEQQQTGKLPAPLPSAASHISIHGHCHQKALFGTKAMKSLLDNSTVTEIPSGCCGMAGSFGYEKEHYELSKKVGEEILFPAVNALNDKTTVVACGVSCRHQIAHFTGVNKESNQTSLNIKFNENITSSKYNYSLLFAFFYKCSGKRYFCQFPARI